MAGRCWVHVHMKSGDVRARYVLGPVPLSARLVEALPPRVYVILRSLRLVRIQVVQ